MKQLPKYFAIKRDAENPLWKKYITWLNEKCGGNSYNYYYGFDGVYYYGRFNNSPEIITLEQWDEAVNGFVLPEKWCIKKDRQEVCDWFSRETRETYSLISRNDWYIHWPSTSLYYLEKRPKKGYTEITFEQFKKYVLKEDLITENPKILPFEEWQSGDIIECVADCNRVEGEFTNGKLYTVRSISKRSNVVSVMCDDSNKTNNGWLSQHFKFHSRPVKKNLSLPLVEKQRKINAQQAQSIIDVAETCCKWKTILVDLWSKDICLKNEISVSEDLYKEMRLACTTSQHLVLDGIFGKEEKEFDSSMLKVGEFIKSDLTGNVYIKTET